jgi:hypothetical protein
MEDLGDGASTRLAQPSAPRQLGRRWLLIGGLALAFMLTLGVGALLGSTAFAANSAQAASFATGGANNSQTLAATTSDANSSQALAVTPGARGQCEALTVSSVNASTIVAKAPDGSTVTIQTTASTQYTRAGQSVSASTITVGSRIHVTGTRNSDGSITATRIDIG